MICIRLTITFLFATGLCRGNALADGPPAFFSDNRIAVDQNKVDPNTALFEEANLRAVMFIDADRGWSAGDRGTVLHTEDQGVSWKQQPTGTAASLADIAMYNSKRGLAIGGYYQGYTQLSIGEVVVTEDGGLKWRVTTGHDLPRLRQLIVGPGGKCVAVGDWSPVHLTCVFASENGGQTWQPQPCLIAGPAVGIAGSVDDYLVLSDQGEVVRFKADSNPQKLFPPGDDWRSLAGNENRRLLVGPRGMIESQDQGETWHVNSRHPGASPALATAALEPAAALELAESGTAVMWKDEIWAVNDSSSSITVFRPTSLEAISHPGQASVRRIIRLDRDRGWAVGDFGLILTTRDAGQTWRTLRGGNRMVAVMVIGSQPVLMPWTLFAIESLQHQRRVALVIDRRDKKVTISERDSVSDASTKLGPSSLFIASDDGNRIAEILRLAKPAVMVLDQTLQPDQRAAWSAAALESGVQRVLEVGARGSQTIHVASAIPSAGILASDVWFDAIALLSPDYSPPSKVMLSARLDATNDRLAGDGLATCVGNDARYCWSRETTNSRRQLQVLQARTTEMNWIESLVTNAKSSDEFKSLLEPMLPRIVDSDRQRVFARLMALIGKHARQDLHVAALEVLIDDADKRPDKSSEKRNDLIALARLRLAAVTSSSEWHQTFGNAAMILPTSRMAGFNTTTHSPVNLAVQLSPFQTQVAPALEMNASNRRNGGVPRYDEPLDHGVKLASGTTEIPPANKKVSTSKVDLRWQLHPAVLMVGRANEMSDRVLNAPLQTLGESPLNDTSSEVDTSIIRASDNHVATKNLRRVAEHSASGRWGLLAKDALSTATNVCPIATSRPMLDGTFDEPWWGDGKSLPDGTANSVLRFAHDEEFFYISIDAAILNPASHTAKIRQRDTPLDSSDRYCVRLDIDRDLMTAYEFEFDSVGNTRDSCDGFLQFQPRWFIACSQFDGRTKAEIAIQKSDISPLNELHDTIWNVSIQRLILQTPGHGLALPDPMAWQPVWLQ